MIHFGIGAGMVLPGRVRLRPAPTGRVVRRRDVRRVRRIFLLGAWPMRSATRPLQRRVLRPRPDAGADPARADPRLVRRAARPRRRGRTRILGAILWGSPRAEVVTLVGPMVGIDVRTSRALAAPVRVAPVRVREDRVGAASRSATGAGSRTALPPSSTSPTTPAGGLPRSRRPAPDPQARARSLRAARTVPVIGGRPARPSRRRRPAACRPGSA